MNWFKKYCSHNLRFPENIDYQIDNIVNKYIYFCKNFNELSYFPFFIGDIKFLDNYYGKEIQSKVYIGKDIINFRGGVAAKTNRDTKEIFINMFKEVYDKNYKINFDYLFHITKNSIYHELTHIIDPKIVKLDNIYKEEDYYVSDIEFDAYSQEITKYITQAFFKDTANKDVLIRWISSDSFGEYVKEIEDMLDMPYNRYEIIKLWKNKKPMFLRKLRQRIYNGIKK